MITQKNTETVCAHELAWGKGPNSICLPVSALTMTDRPKTLLSAQDLC